MPNWLKWLLIVSFGLVACVVLALLVVPMFIDIQQYKPVMERKVSEATGRPFSIGGDLSLSLFPWAGVSFSDLRLGNPEGFENPELLKVDAFDVRVKLLPLIQRDIQIKRFVIDGVRIALEKNARGAGNWEGIGQQTPSEEKQTAKPRPETSSLELPIKSLAVGECAVRNASLVWIDGVKGERRELTDFSLVLQDVSLERPIRMALSAKVDGRPLTLDGSIGPLGTDIGKGTLPVEMALGLFDQLKVLLKGRIQEPAGRQNFDLAVNIAPFSPRKLLASLDMEMPVQTADPKVLEKFSLDAKIEGDPQSLSVSSATIGLDDSKIDMSARLREFEKPDISFKVRLDEIDLDRYLPPKTEAAPQASEEPAAAEEKQPVDYAPLRKLVLEGVFQVGRLKIQGAKLQDIDVKVTGKGGRFQVDPMDLKLYQGAVDGLARIDVRGSQPKTNLDLRANGIQINPLLNDLLQKDFLEGVLESTVALSLEGDDPDRIKPTLNGKGDLMFRDGAIKGVDLTSMVQNVKSSFGMAAQEEKVPRTDFSEFHLPFTLVNGLFKTDRTLMNSPLLRVLAAGKADLVKETLDFRLDPKFVTTLKGQGDATPGRRHQGGRPDLHGAKRQVQLRHGGPGRKRSREPTSPNFICPSPWSTDSSKRTAPL